MDQKVLRQILLNLAGNAIKFTAAGEVIIEVKMLEETDRQTTLHFAVTDTGIGIPPDRLNRLFQVFSQADASVSRQYGGSGLGLAISKQLVELMGGQVGVASEEGNGSTFWFTAVLGKQPAGQQEVPIVALDLNNQHILAVDDHAANRLVLRGALKSWGCRVDEAVDGKEALAKLYQAAESGDPFHIAIIDMIMPGMNGDELGRMIKSDPVLRDTKLVMLASMGMRGDAARMKEIGFAAYLNKPIKTSLLHDCLVKIGGHKPPTSTTAQPPLVTRYLLAEDKKQGWRILLAEDNEINQKIGKRILEKLGYQVELADNGLEAVKAVATNRYDLILMDVQMPEMDGFEATAVIREREKATGKHIPIIALTAHAMAGDKERCLAAGMDGYLTKPVQSQEILQAIDAVIEGTVKSEIVDSQENKPSALFDRAFLMNSIDGDEELAREIISSFTQGTIDKINGLRLALENNDIDKVNRLAHSLNGAAATIGAQSLRGIACQIEQAGKNIEMDLAKALLPKLEEEFAKLQGVLKRP